MTLFELQAWLGHQSPATTQHYVSTSPTKFAQAYRDAVYFARNVRAIEVLAHLGAAVAVVEIKESGQETEDLIRADRGHVRFFQTDVADPPDMEQLQQQVQMRFGEAGILVNSAMKPRHELLGHPQS